MIYVWKEATYLSAKGDAQKIGDRLEVLRLKNNGVLTPALIVDDARKARAPHHDCFEWDDSEAAAQYRLTQARHLLGSVAVIMEDSATGEERTVRAFVNFRDDSGTPDTSLYAAMSDKEIRAQILVRAKAEFDSWHKRYQDLEELALVFAAMDEVAA